MGVEHGELIVVDEATHTDEAVVSFLRDRGYDVLIIPTEAGCLHRIRESRPDLVLLSLTHDAIDSLSLLQETRNIDPDLPVVVLSDAAHADQIVPLLKAGANDYLMLPVPDLALVNHVVHETIRGKQETRHRKQIERDLEKRNRLLLDNLKL
ncbi:MAG: response regulator, partial [Pseudomonadales bacterium]|nr:response regulator [Pseudomonadales bacterium]